MAETGRSARECLENLNLHRGVGDMILAPDDVGDAEVDVVDHRGQRIEVGAVLPAEDRIGQRRAVDAALAAHHIVPAHCRRFEPEAPMGLAARSFERRPLAFRQAQRGAIIDWRAAERLLPLAAPVELLRCLIGGVETVQGFEPCGCLIIGCHPLGLAPHQVRLNSQPLEIRLDRVGVFRLRTMEIRIIEAKDECSPAALGEQPVEECCAGVADVDAPGRRGCETDDRGRGHFAFIEASRRRGNMV